MRMASKILAGASFLLALACLACAPRAETDSSTSNSNNVVTAATNEIPLERCHFALERVHSEGAYTIIISSVLNGEHRPEGLRILRNPAEISEEQLRACLAGWTLATVPSGTQVVAAFRYETGAGWQYVRLSAEEAGFFEEIPMEGFADGPRR